MTNPVSPTSLTPEFKQLDRDHEELHAVLSDVSKHIALGAPNLSDSLILLIGCLSAHFRREETIMEKLGYNALAIHRKQHAVLERGFKDVLRDIEMGRFSETTKALYQVFEEGLEKHNTQSDSLLLVADDNRQTSEMLEAAMQH